ncbi:MAG: hypothetical protein AAF530_06790 [Pseudomonadota bacterium]
MTWSKVEIRQHGEDGQIYDMPSFFEDLEKFFSITKWHVDMDWCLGNRAGELVKTLKASSGSLSDHDLRHFYEEIFQTVDGEFAGFKDDKYEVKLTAFDSTLWILESDNQVFLNHMVKKYGLPQPLPTKGQ